MVRRRLPLWLLLDPAAWLALMFSVWRLVGVVREMLAKPDDGRGILAQADLARMAEALAITEADIDWAIARQVRRLCGLAVGDVVRVVPTPARTLPAFRARYDAQVRRMTECNAIAQRRAARAMHAATQPVSSVEFPASATLVLSAPEVFALGCIRGGAAHARAPPAPCIMERHALQT